jgi:hypothetical protein
MMPHKQAKSCRHKKNVIRRRATRRRKSTRRRRTYGGDQIPYLKTQRSIIDNKIKEITEKREKYDTQLLQNPSELLHSELDDIENELVQLNKQKIELPKKPEDFASVPPLVQYEGVCYAHAFARSLLRTLRVLGLVTHNDNDSFYYALFIFGLSEEVIRGNMNVGGNPANCFTKFIVLIYYGNPEEFFDISSNVIKDNVELLKNIPAEYQNDTTPFLKDFKDKQTFIEQFNELYKTGKIYLMHQEYKVDMEKQTPISSDIKDALVLHLQPTISTYGHAMVLRGWGGTGDDINTVYIKNTWKNDPIIVVSDLSMLAREIHNILLKDGNNIGVFDESKVSKFVVFDCLMIENDYYYLLRGNTDNNTIKNNYKPTYKCFPISNKCIADSKDPHIRTFMWILTPEKNYWIPIPLVGKRLGFISE